MKSYVISGSCSLSLSREIANVLGIEVVEPFIGAFPNGEIFMSLSRFLRQQDTIIVKSICKPIHDSWMEIFFMVDLLRQIGVCGITLVIPYFSYSRQDHNPCDDQASVSLYTLLRMLKALGVHRVLSLDSHTEVHDDFFFNIDVRDILIELNSEECFDVIVSPDNGSFKRVSPVIHHMNAEFVHLKKERILGDSMFVHINQLDRELLQGKNCLIVDDIIDTGLTIKKTVEVLFNSSINSVSVFATHAVCDDRVFKELANLGIKTLYTTNSSIHTSNSNFLKIISIAGIIGKYLKSNMPSNICA
jgi:ribose-phosphate pyrophosphokinase